MKKTILLAGLWCITSGLFAQKADYKDGMITVDGKNIAKVFRIKDRANLGLTSTYELYALTGEKLIIATISTEFAQARNDNSTYYYRFSFLGANQTAIFTLSKLGPEKAFAKLIGESGIVVDNKIDPQILNEFIAMKSKNPRNPNITYNMVERTRIFSVFVRDNQVIQDDKVIGLYKDVTRQQSFDSYEFSLPDGLVIARVRFTGGENAKNFSVTTLKDNVEQSPFIGENGTYGKPIITSAGMDRNYRTIKKIATWLVEKKYL